MEGYGLYWYCLECVARNVENHNLTFELEEDAELIAADTGIHHERVEEMMRYMISLHLFEASEGRITCLKMASRADEYTQKLIRNQVVMLSSGQTPDSVGTKSLLREENRTEQKEQNNNKNDDAKFFKMKELSALASKYLGWNGSLNQGRAESLRPLTNIFKADVERGFKAACDAGATSIKYVEKVAADNQNIDPDKPNAFLAAMEAKKK